MSLLFPTLFIVIGLLSSILCFYFVSISFIHYFNIDDSNVNNKSNISNTDTNTNNIQVKKNELLHSYINTNISTNANNWKNHYNDKLISPNLFHLPTWGSFRPGIYFGMKSRTMPVSLSTGILWQSEFITNNPPTNLRHSTSQDELTNFQWLRHNGKSFGVEHITDKSYGMEIYASYILPKVFMIDNKMKNSNKFIPTWVQRLSVSSTEQSNFTKSLLFYIGVESNNKQDGLIDSLKVNDNIKGFKILKDNTNVIGTIEDDRDLVYEGGRITGFDDSFIIIGNTKQTNHFCVKINIYDIAQGKNKDSKVSYVGLSNDVNTATKKIQNDAKFLKLQSKNKDNKNKKADLSTFNMHGDLKGTIDEDTSLFTIQATSTSPSFVMEIVYYENTDNRYFNFDSTSEHIEAKWTEILQHYTSSEITSDIDFWMEEAIQKFEVKFENVYKLSEKLDKKGKKSFSTKDMEVAKRALSATLGGIGYFYGKPKLGNGIDIDSDLDSITTTFDEIIDCDPVSLLSATPSRTSFPRGFLWDEGFHQLLINQWDESITIHIITDWLNSMYKCDIDQSNCIGGWIPREMILGDDAKNRVPDEFVTQRVNIANPPTLLLVIEKIIDRHYKDTSLEVSIDGNNNINQYRDQILIYLKKSYPYLNRWLQWFLSSQNGNTEGSFRWRGRSKSDNKLVPNTLASGLDDYPRAQIPTKDEYHVDLLSWMIRSSKIMMKLKKLIIDNKLEDTSTFQEDKFDYESIYNHLITRLDPLHWSDEYKSYLDYGLDSSNSEIVKQIAFRCQNPRDGASKDVLIPVEKASKIKDPNEICPSSHSKYLFPLGDGNGGYLYSELVLMNNPKLQLIPRIGYVSIFPLILQALPADSIHFNEILDIIESKELLWSNYGLRSLSTKDMFYNKANAPGDAPYWRGPIWIPVNYLALSALYHYSYENIGPNRERCESIYLKLRNNVQNTILKSYHKTNYFWEQYKDNNGEGMRGHPFSGWTALVINIMAEKY